LPATAFHPVLDGSPVIERLRGELLEKQPRHLVVDCAGVGYGLDISTTTYEALPLVGQPVDLFVHTHVREDALELFGFVQREERELFLVLQTISGVGPGMALTLLSSLSPANLARAVEAGDATALTRVKGVGRKTADRLVLELKGKLKALALTAQSDDGAAAAMLAGNAPAREAIAALMELGMKEPQAEKAIAAAVAALPEDASTQQLVIEGLKWRKS